MTRQGIIVVELHSSCFCLLLYSLVLSYSLSKYEQNVSLTGVENMKCVNLSFLGEYMAQMNSQQRSLLAMVLVPSAGFHCYQTRLLVPA